MQNANKMMHIVHISFAYYPYMNLGGVPRSVFDLTRSQRGRYRLTVITNRIDDRPVNSINVIYLKNLSRDMIYRYQLYTPLINTDLIVAIKEADLLHFHGYRNLLNDIAFFVNRFFKKPYIITSHGTLMNYESKKGIKRVYDRVLGRAFLKGAGCIVAHSDVEREEILKSYPYLKEVVVIPNGIFVQDLKKVSDVRVFYEKYGIDTEKKIILFIGKITPRKGLEVCLDAFVRVGKRDLQFVIAGETMGYDIKGRLRGIQNVKYIGHLDMEDKINAICASEVVLYPTIYEAFGYVPFESILLGKPCIVGDDFGTAEHLSPVASDLVISYGDSIELSNLILKLLKEAPYRDRLINRVKSYVLNNYSMHRVVDAYDKIYKKLGEGQVLHD